MMAHMPTISMRKTTMRNTVPRSSARLTPRNAATHVVEVPPIPALLSDACRYGTEPGVGRETTMKSLTVDRLAWSVAPAAILTTL
jgi:hypothetical protein